MLNNYFILMILCLSFCSNLFGQNTQIEGAILNNNNKQIENATIILKNNKSNQILSYTFSDKNGYFKLIFNNLSEDRLMLSCSILGYKTISCVFTDSIHFYNFILEENKHLLREVEVKANFLVQEYNDTTEYNLKALKHDPNDKLESLLKKLPGLNVASDGSISYKGKPIRKILIEGSDLFDYNYKIASKGIDSKYLKKIQVINNYEENKVLKKIEKSDEVIINLLLNDSKNKNLLFGDVNIGLGSNKNYFINPALFSLKGKIKFYNNFNMSNSPLEIVKDNLILNDYFDMDGSFVTAGFVIANNQSYSIEQNETASNQLYNSLNFSYKPNKVIDISTTLYYNKLRENFQNSQTNTYFSDKTIYKDSSFYENNYSKLLITNKINYEISKRLFLIWNFKIESSPISQFNQRFFELNTNEYIKNNSTEFLSKLKLSIGLKDSSAFNINLNSLINVNGQDYLLNELNTNNVFIEQNSFANNNIYKIKTEYLNRNHSNISYNLFFEQKFVSQNISTNTMSKKYSNNLYLRSSSQKAGALFKATISSINFAIEPSINYLTFNFGVSDPKNKSRLEFLYDINLNWNINKNNAITVATSNNLEYTDILKMLEDTVLLNNRSMTVGLNDLIFSENYSYSLAYSYFNLQHRNSFSFLFDNYSFNAQSTNTAIINDYYVNSVFNLQNTKLRNININYEQYIDPLRFRFRWSNSFIQSKNSNFYNFIQRNSEMYNINTKLQIVPVFDLPFDLQFGLKLNFLNYTIKGLINSNTMSYVFNQDLIIRFNKNFKLKLSMDQFFSGNPKKCYFLLSPKINYHLDKKLELGLNTFNLLNIKYVSEYQINEFYSNSQLYYITPLQALLFIRYSF